MSNSDFRALGSRSARDLLFRDGPMTGEHWRNSFPEIIGRSPTMLNVLETVSKVARSDSAVLVYGESGTGKELIAKAIHRLSPRADKAFVAINCSAIPELLLESELFGYEKGAFTGADKRRAGKFEHASGGTIFLDEIGDMPAQLQAKLLRVLQEKRFTPIGSNESREADVRIIAATNVDLESAVKKQSFRLDLYYRLNVLPVQLPALRERSEDIPALLEHFLEISNRAHPGEGGCWLTPEAVDVLKRYGWPGNIRELQNTIERLVVLRSEGPIHVEHLPDQVLRPHVTTATPVLDSFAPSDLPMSRPAQAPQTHYPTSFGATAGTVQTLPTDGIDLIGYIEKLENSLIIQALERTQGNKNQAAKLLGLNRTTLVERIKKRKIVALNDPSKEL